MSGSTGSQPTPLPVAVEGLVRRLRGARAQVPIQSPAGHRGVSVSVRADADDRSSAPSLRIPFNVPTLGRRSIEYAMASLAGGKHSGDGLYTERASRALRELLGGADVLLTTSGTHALELAALLLGLGPGDEVIVPSFTFVSTASSIARTGATPVFVDIRPDTLNICPAAIEAAITPRTKAIVVMHYAGISVELEPIRKIAEGRDLALIEDNAHGIGGAYSGRPLGTFGDLAAQSFHETKNVQCGEGGALVMNRPDLVARAEVLREKGTNRSEYFRGAVDKYTWIDLGSSYLPSDVLAAVLLGGLEDHAVIRRERRRIWTAYHEGLASWARDNDVQQPTIPIGVEHPGHLYYLILPSEGLRDDLLRHLDRRGIHATSHYVPLHDSPGGRRFGRTAAGCEVTNRVSARLLRLPLYPSLAAEDVSRVIAVTSEFRC